MMGAGNVVGVDPLDAKVNSEDARRFAAVFYRSNAKPSARALQRGYLEGSGRGVEIFTPGRIQNAEHLAKVVSQNQDMYRRGIEVCLPLAESLEPELKSIYLGLKGLFPDRPLPEIFVVFGGANSGGTAGSDAQVLGLEVLCRIGETEEELRAIFRSFFAHETVHTMQDNNFSVFLKDPLLTQSLREGMADYVATLVTGKVPTPERDAWATANEAMLWREFQKDRELILDAVARGETYENPSPETEAAFSRWHGNAFNPPEGWHHEAGYWVGRRIITAFGDNAPDKRAAIDELMTFDDPGSILERSGYPDTMAD